MAASTVRGSSPLVRDLEDKQGEKESQSIGWLRCRYESPINRHVIQEQQELFCVSTSLLPGTLTLSSPSFTGPTQCHHAVDVDILSRLQEYGLGPSPLNLNQPSRAVRQNKGWLGYFHKGLASPRRAWRYLPQIWR